MKSKSQSDPKPHTEKMFPVPVQHISLCPESRKLLVAGASSHVMLYNYCKTETNAEVKVRTAILVIDYPRGSHPRLNWGLVRLVYLVHLSGCNFGYRPSESRLIITIIEN